MRNSSWALGLLLAVGVSGTALATYGLARGQTGQTAPQPSASVSIPPASLAPLPAPSLATDRPLAAMSPDEVNAFLATLQGKSLTERIEAVSARALGTPYFLGPLGEGPGAPFDSKPLIDLTRVDCVTFCEQTLALALSPDYASAQNTLQRIRYKNGEIAMETRNHYFMADWVPNNAWLVTDITAQLPGHQWLERTISHRQLFASNRYTGIQVREPDRPLKKAYIPESALNGIEKHLRSGDIAVLIQNAPGIFAAHTGIMIQKSDGSWVLRNATSLEPKQVVDTPWPVLIASLQKSQRLIGLSFARPRVPSGGQP